MSHFPIDVDSGKTVRLPTGGKYCPEDIVVTAKGGNNEAAYHDGFTAGKQSEYDLFWDAYQQNGERTDYSYAFMGSGWTVDTYKPKYPLQPVAANNMFASCAYTGRIDVDLSKCINVTAIFSGAKCSEIGVLDFSLCGGLNYILGPCPNLTKVEKVIVTAGIAINSGTFSNSPLLTRLVFEGEIGNNWDIRNLPALDNESAQSVIDCLIDLTGQPAKTVTFHNNVGKKLTEEQKATIAAKNWTLVY